MLQELKRLSEDLHGIRQWKKWGPYLSERQWGTVREDYSGNGDAWGYISHDLSRSKAYRWGEDGLGGISDDQQKICFGWTFWNHLDNILKERLFGLTGPQGNHGEDVKEYYYYLDNLPTHAYMKMLYKYPQRPFPYLDLVSENGRRSREEGEYELIDTGIFDGDRYFDLEMEYAKIDEEDMLIQLTIHNRSKKTAFLDVLPTLWFRNTWRWEGREAYRPKLESYHPGVIDISHQDFAPMSLYCDEAVDLLFCENESNPARVPWEAAQTETFKDGFHEYIIRGNSRAIQFKRRGTKAAAHYRLRMQGGEKKVIRLRLGPAGNPTPFAGFRYIFDQRIQDAHAFYTEKQAAVKDEDARNIQRQAYAGMLWSKQFYHYNVHDWLSNSPHHNEEVRARGRNHDWKHLRNADIISMPDKWEYPWYAAWDLAFHCLTLASLDTEFAKHQLTLLTEGTYMHPNGQLPAYEWNFSDVNPPVHAWACWRVYQMEKKEKGEGDLRFLEQVYHKLLLNFSWWVNRKDGQNNNIFQGGFLGLDNIGVFDRSAKLPTGGYIEQADGTSWMAMYCLNLLRISLELATENPVYQKMAGKFFEHFLYIAGAMTNIGNEGINLWDEEDQFFYDVLCLPDGKKTRLKVRSMVGLSPLFAVEVLEQELLDAMPEFTAHMEWFLEHRPDLSKLVSRWKETGQKDLHLLSMLRGHRMKRVLQRMLDETEFLSDYGIRALSRYHKDTPYVFDWHGTKFEVSYLPAESDSAFFGGNSNWRGPVWFPVNYLLIESLHKFYAYYGDSFRVEYPTGSGTTHSLREVAIELSKRLTRIFLRDEKGRRAVFGSHKKFQEDPHFRDHILFYEYFHGDNGRGVGASHQTGWTGLVATLMDQIPPEEDPEEEYKFDSFYLST